METDDATRCLIWYAVAKWGITIDVERPSQPIGYTRINGKHCQELFKGKPLGHIVENSIGLQEESLVA
jgi:hypothetical protein